MHSASPLARPTCAAALPQVLFERSEGILSFSGSGTFVWRSSAFSSPNSIDPSPLGSKLSYSCSISSIGAFRPKRRTPRQNSRRDTRPSPLSSHATKRSVTRVRFTRSASRSCSCTDAVLLSATVCRSRGPASSSSCSWCPPRVSDQPTLAIRSRGLSAPRRFRSSCRFLARPSTSRDQKLDSPTSCLVARKAAAARAAASAASTSASGSAATTRVRKSAQCSISS